MVYLQARNKAQRQTSQSKNKLRVIHIQARLGTSFQEFCQYLKAQTTADR
jgi:hypothetical protein